MKALIYKEFKLAMHPICYLFIILFPLMVLIPSYPLAIGFIYVLTTYPIIFLGANKGQQSNDLLYSTLLPVRKKDIVLARIITVAILLATFIAIMSCLVPVAKMIQTNLANEASSAEELASIEIPGIGLDGYVSILAIAIVGFSIADLIFFPLYYRNGKSIVMSTLFTIFGFVIYISIFTIVLPYVNGFEGYLSFFQDVSVGVQFIYLAVAIVIYIVSHFFTYKISSKLLEKVDF